jgi:hypothetical protein
MNTIRLKEMIQNLRSELIEAKDEGEGETLQFLVEDVEIELEVLASKKAEGGGKVEFLVYTAELAGELAKSSKQRLKLRLKPLTPEGDLKVSRRRKIE